jgi:Tfp pilus assembly protein PilO
MKMLTFKDKESIDSRMAAVTLQVQNYANRTTEIEKDVIRLLAILPNRAEVPKLKEDENN